MAGIAAEDVVVDCAVELGGYGCAVFDGEVADATRGVDGVWCDALCWAGVDATPAFAAVVSCGLVDVEWQSCDDGTEKEV